MTGLLVLPQVDLSICSLAYLLSLTIATDNNNILSIVQLLGLTAPPGVQILCHNHSDLVE